MKYRPPADGGVEGRSRDSSYRMTDRYKFNTIVDTGKGFLVLSVPRWEQSLEKFGLPMTSTQEIHE